jgi:hypothetical protein
MSSKSLPVLLAAAACLVGTASTADAQSRGRAVARGPVVGRAAPRVYAPSRVYGRVISPRIVGYAPYRPYYYGYRPGLTIGFYSGFGYPYGYPYYGYYPYGYRSYYGYSSYGYGGYGYGPYGYPLPPASYVSMQPGVAYGGVRIQGAPRDAQVFADGYYVGIVDDFDGITQHLNLEAGVHKIELRLPNQPPIEFDVNVQPGQTITYHAGITR